MTQQSVVFMFPSIDSVSDLAALLDYTIPYVDFAAREYGSSDEQIIAKEKLRDIVQWVVLLHDFVRNQKVPC